MAVVVRLPSITHEQYEKINQKLSQDAPSGLLIHVSFGAGDKIEGLQVWESEEAWGADMPRVLPVLAEAGIETATPPTPVPAVFIAGSKVNP